MSTEETAETPATVERFDDWANVVNGLGVIGRDASASGQVVPCILSQEQLLQIYRYDDACATIVDTPPFDALRKGFAVNVEEKDPDKKREIETYIAARLADLHFAPCIEKAAKYDRAYGGSAIFIGAVDGATPDAALAVNKIQSVSFAHMFERVEINALTWQDDPTKPDYGIPEIYQVINPTDPKNSKIHRSRLLIFDGVQVSNRILREQSGWGDSIIVRIMGALKAYNLGHQGSAKMLQQFVIKLLKMKKLAELVSATSPEKVQQRARAISMGLAVSDTMIIDSEESYEQLTAQVNGVSDLLDKANLRLAAAAGFPVARLLGQSPGGLGSSGAAEIRFFYDLIEAYRTTKIHPHIERFVKVLLLCKDGPTKGIEPKNWQVHYPALWQETATEQAAIRKTQSETDRSYYDMGSLSSDEIRSSRFSGEYTIETTIDDTVDLVAEPTTPDTAVATQNATQRPVMLITPSDMTIVVTVNEVRAQSGYGPMLLPSGEQDPDGYLTVARYMAKYSAVVSEAAAAGAGAGAIETPPAPTATEGT